MTELSPTARPVTCTAGRRVTSRLAAAIPVDNPYCSCELTRVRSRAAVEAMLGPRSPWRDGHSADTPSPSMLKHLLKAEGVQQSDRTLVNG